MPSVAELQKFFQRGGAYTHLLGGATDRITSVAIPVAFTVTATALLARGLHNLYTGQGRRDQ